MNTLANEYLLYDEDCPLCEWYTKQFIQRKLLLSDERVSYNQAIASNQFEIDELRAKNEIALIARNGEIYYGIDSLLHIFGRRYTWIERIGHFFPVYLLLKVLYKLISFNRKVIAPADCNALNSCEPTFNIRWRLVFILLAGWLTNLIVGQFFEVHFSTQLRFDIPYMDFYLFVGQIMFQGIIFFILNERNFLNYAGQLAVISVIGAILLGGMNLGITLLVNNGLDVGILAPAALGIVIGIMFLEHMRRIKVLHHTKWLSFTWIAYRLAIYPLVFEL